MTILQFSCIIITTTPSRRGIKQQYRLPIKKLIRYEGNIYELVSATVKRARQITEVRAAFNPTTLEEQPGTENTPAVPQPQKFGDQKAAAIAYREILNGEVVYKIREE